MGTPDFAAASLKKLAAWPRAHMVAVYTQPDRPAGRGHKLAACPVKKLALEIGVSEATIIRFCKKIGYAGLLNLKADLKRELLDDSDLSLPSSPDIFLDDSRNDVAQKIALTIETSTRETIGLLEMKIVKPVVERFLSARRVMFVGFGASGLAALEARDKMNRLGIDSEAFTDRFTMTLKLANLKADDLVVAFSHSGETPLPWRRSASPANAVPHELTSDRRSARWSRRWSYG